MDAEIETAGVSDWDWKSLGFAMVRLTEGVSAAGLEVGGLRIGYVWVSNLRGAGKKAVKALLAFFCEQKCVAVVMEGGCFSFPKNGDGALGVTVWKVLQKRGKTSTVIRWNPEGGFSIEEEIDLNLGGGMNWRARVGSMTVGWEAAGGVVRWARRAGEEGVLEEVVAWADELFEDRVVVDVWVEEGNVVCARLLGEAAVWKGIGRLCLAFSQLFKGLNVESGRRNAVAAAGLCRLGARPYGVGHSVRFGVSDADDFVGFTEGLEFLDVSKPPENFGDWGLTAERAGAVSEVGRVGGGGDSGDGRDDGDGVDDESGDGRDDGDGVDDESGDDGVSIEVDGGVWKIAVESLVFAVIYINEAAAYEGGPGAGFLEEFAQWAEGGIVAIVQISDLVRLGAKRTEELDGQWRRSGAVVLDEGMGRLWFGDKSCKNVGAWKVSTGGNSALVEVRDPDLVKLTFMNALGLLGVTGERQVAAVERLLGR